MLNGLTFRCKLRQVNSDFSFYRGHNNCLLHESPVLVTVELQLGSGRLLRANVFTVSCNPNTTTSFYSPIVCKLTLSQTKHAIFIEMLEFSDAHMQTVISTGFNIS